MSLAPNKASCAIYFTYGCRKRLPTQRPICKTEQQGGSALAYRTSFASPVT